LFLQVSFFGEDPKKFKAQDVLKIISSTCDDYTKAYAMTPYSTSSALRCAVLLCAALRCAALLFSVHTQLSKLRADSCWRQRHPPVVAVGVDCLISNDSSCRGSAFDSTHNIVD
jgi:hypothetical protein